MKHLGLWIGKQFAERKMSLPRGTTIRLSVLIALMAMVFFLRSLPQKGVELYVDNIYPFYASMANALSDRFSFSLFEISILFFILFIFYLLIRIFLYVLRRNWSATFCLLGNGVIGLLSVAVWFYLAWGINYYRLSPSFLTQEEESPIDQEELIRALELYIEDFKRLPAVISKPKTEDIHRLAREGIDLLFHSHRSSLRLPRRPKTFYFNYAMETAHTSGLFSPLFHEVHYNRSMPEASVPFVLYHELAHAAGISSERDANLAAYLATRNHPNDAIRYSCLLNTFIYLFHNVEDEEEYRRLYGEIPPRVIEDFEARRRYWLSCQTFLTDISKRIYDLYLRSNNTPEGIKSYGKIVSFIVRRELEREPRDPPPRE